MMTPAMGIPKEEGERRSLKVRSIRAQPSASRRVLLVEDHLDTVHSMAIMLKSMGHEVQFAINGFAAIDIARSFRPEFILIDIGLPDFKGDEIARQIKWEPGLEHTRIIAITGRSDDEVRQRAIDAGCEELFVKPMSPVALEELLAN
jgi:CheY-like chemotaxis protein